MNSHIETGHAKNVANFEDLISFCIGYGTSYNPANANLTIAGLQAKNTAALAAIHSVKTAKTNLDNATNAREILFSSLRKFATRLVNALAAAGAAQQTIDDARTINRKLQGQRSHSKTTKADAGKVAAPGDTTMPVPREISVSQQSYDSLVDHFGKLVETLTAEPLYTPNEVDLQLGALNALGVNLRAANTAVINATTAYSNERIVRDTTLYAPHTGLVDVALDVKTYIKSLFGVSSPQYKQVSGLVFKHIKT